MSVTRTTTANLRTEDALESSIRDSALSNVARMRQAPDTDSEVIAADLGKMLQRVSGVSVSEIDRVMADLQAVREHLENEGARVQRTLNEFAHLSQTSVQSVNAIADALAQIKRVADLPSRT
jgi:uncharacterized protein YfkK (UPF0435 family)